MSDLIFGSILKGREPLKLKFAGKKYMYLGTSEDDKTLRLIGCEVLTFYNPCSYRKSLLNSRAGAGEAVLIKDTSVVLLQLVI